MPLPLPDLDNRVFDDLVEEARVLIPRHASEWTDHNVSDPGITLIELFAWMVEQQVYRLNRVPERHRRKFLELVGFPTAPPRPARAAVRFVPPAAGTVELPAGLALGAVTPDRALTFRTLAAVTVGRAGLASVQVFDGEGYLDRTGDWREGRAFAGLGDDPAPGAALLLGLDRGLTANRPLSLWLSLGGVSAGHDARQGLAEEAARIGPPLDRTRHHAARTVWEVFDGTDWSELGKGSVDDATRGLTLGGAVVLRPPTSVPLAETGAVSEPRAWLRCRAAAGPLDLAPTVEAVAVNAVEVEQRRPARSRIELPPGSPAPPAPGPGERGLAFTLAGGNIESIADSADPDAPRAALLSASAATPAAPGDALLTLVRVGTGTGLPAQEASLGAQATGGQVRLWTVTPDGTALPWHRVPDFVGAGPAERAFVLAPAAQLLRFGDGRHGAPPGPAHLLLAAWDATAGSVGLPGTKARWTLAGADDDLNAALLGGPVAPVAAALPGIELVGGVAPGADDEGVAAAAGRAAAELWAHERLVELAERDGRITLDGLPRSAVLERLAPRRATTALDFERLALDVPGAPVARARAWPCLDPALPCVHATGTVTVVIVPWLARDRPSPSPALVGAVRRSLELRRTIATRLIVAGPEYVQVQLSAGVVALARTSQPERVRLDVLDALERFLHPLWGGADGGGWPFGRDLMVAELLGVIDAVQDVDHVDDLELSTPGGPSRCGDLCLGPLALPLLGRCDVTVT